MAGLSERPTEKIKRDDAIGRRSRGEAEGPIVGVATNTVNEDERRAGAHIVVADGAAEDLCAA